MSPHDAEPWLQFAGRLHPLLLHLPIGLWFGVAAVELGGSLIRRPPARGTVLALAWMAAVAGALTAGSGWVLGLEGEHSGRNFELHRWLGVSVGAVGLCTAIAACFPARRAFRMLLLALLCVLMPCGHLGGSMTHGEDHLTAPFAERETQPAPAAATKPVAAPDPQATGAQATPATAATPAAAAPKPTFAQVSQVLARTCHGCHNEQKHKGDLQLLDRATIERGGKNGAVLVPGKPDESPMLARLLLPADHDDHMPPKGKPQPNAAEIELLRAWIAAGAPFDAAAPTPNADATTKAAAPLPPKTPEPPTQVQEAPKAPAAVPAAPAPVAPTPTPAVPTPTPAAKPPIHPQAIEAVRQSGGDVREPPPGGTGLEISFAANAAALTEAQVRSLLTPLLDHIAELDLARVPAGDGLGELCGRMPLLRRLDLSATQITGKSVLALRSLPALQKLVLTRTRLDDAAVDALLAMPALQEVYVWNAGLSAVAMARLRGKAGLKVDAGDAPPAKALEVEGDLKFVNELPPYGQKPVAPEVAAALTPVNAVCPVSGKPVDPKFVVVHGQRAVGFCCMNCPKAFWAEPTKYAVKDK